MKTIYFFLLLLIFSPIIYAKNFSSTEKIIAVVNKEIIFESEINKYTNIFFLLSNINEKNLLKNNNLFKKDLIEDIIINKVQLQLAKKYNLEISADKIETIFNNYAKKEKKTNLEYITFIKEKNVPQKQLNQYIKESLIIEKLQKNIIESSVSNIEIEEFIKFSSDIKKTSNTRYSAIYIQLHNENYQTLNKIKWIIKLLNKTNNHKLISKYLQTKLNNQLIYKKINKKNIDTIPTIFTKNIYNMIPGTIIGPIYLNKKFHFMKSLNKTRILEEEINLIKIKHLLIKNYSFNVSNKKNNKIIYKLKTIRTKILSNQNFKRQIALHSESKNNNSKLGKAKWINKKNLSIYLYKHISLLQNGEISYPFSSNLGWHIIEVLDKKYVNKSFNQMLLHHKIEKLINQNKFEHLKNNWIKTLKNESIIKYY